MRGADQRCSPDVDDQRGGTKRSSGSAHIMLVSSRPPCLFTWVYFHAVYSNVDVAIDARQSRSTTCHHITETLEDNV